MDIHLNDLYPEGFDDHPCNETRHLVIDTLEIPSIQTAQLWGEKQTYNLILLCKRHKVECLHLGRYREGSSWFALYTELTNIEPQHFIPPFFYIHLQAIMFSDPMSLPINFGMFFARTPVWSLIFIIRNDAMSIRRSLMKQCLRHILNEKWLCNGSNVMEVRFENSHEIIDDPPDCTEWTRVKHLLQYNLIMREKCRIATTIFLSGKIKKKIIGKDVGKLIACMIWSTRGDPVWRKPKTQGDNLMSRK